MTLSEDYLYEALNSVKEPVFVIDPGGLCVFANRALLELVGRAASVSGSFPVSDFWPRVNECGFDNEHASAEFLTRNQDTYRVRLALRRLSSGCIVARVLAGSSPEGGTVDFHSQRLETLGLLASGIAHDFNNVLAGILGHITYLKSLLPGTGAHLESLRAIEEGALKSSLMTHQILSFSRLEAFERVERVDLGDLVLRTGRLLRGAISKQYELIHELPAEPVYVLAVESKLAQVLVNLAINARDALAVGGTIRVQVQGNIDSARVRKLMGCEDLSSGKFAALMVHDNGHGMSQEVLARAFEPYFSTKEDKGTGLGLYTVQAIVDSCGGAIEVKTTLGKGTSVHIYLPEVEGVRDGAAASKDEPELLQGGSERIMVIDDESPVRNVLSISLRHLGYDVELAGSGREALSLYEASPAGYDLVLLDMLMPELSGAEVFDRLREIDPNVRVLLMSGYASDDVVKGVLARGATGFMPKPFTIEELSHKVRECLN